MQFLANENFPLPSVRLLRQAGYDVASITEDSPGIEDSEVLTRAANKQQVVITFDRDYGELIYRLRLSLPTGVLYLRFRPHTPEEPAILLLNLLQTIRIAIWGAVYGDRAQSDSSATSTIVKRCQVVEADCHVGMD
jgi:predicted nuclease of predicted toxin-antitoxin system